MPAVFFTSFALQGEVEKEEVTDTGEKKYTSSIAGASMNFINSIIGSGIIGTQVLLLATAKSESINFTL